MQHRMLLSMLFSLGLSSTFAGTMGSAEPPTDFSGLYLGLGTGYASFFAADDQLGVNRQDRSTTGFVEFDGHVGYGQFIKEKTYLGAKGSVYYTPLEFLHDRPFLQDQGSGIKTGYLETKATVKPIFNLDAVLGYEIYPHLLPFVEAGVSFANVNTKAVVGESFVTIPGAASSSVTRFDNNASGYKTGYNVGLGASYQAKQNWFLSTELVYNYLGQYSNHYQNGADVDTRVRTYQVVSLFASVSYLFPNV